MIDTLRSLRAEVCEKPLLLIIGLDAFADLNKWHQWQQLFDYAHIIVMARPGNTAKPLAPFFQQHLIDDPFSLARQPSGFLFFQTVTLLDISASQIRQLLAENKNPQFLLPESVLAFIRQQGLYRSHNSVKDIKCKVPN